MQTNLLWTGIAYYSLENCLVNTTAHGAEITSVIVGQHEEKIYKVEYRVSTNLRWETIAFEITCRHDNLVQHFSYQSDGQGNWSENGKPLPQFDGCIDIDIPLTPFTNTLPINRLQLKPNEEQEIRVLYLDLLAKQIKPVRQKYKRLSDTAYHYENVPNDFVADIEVDAAGLVTHYPSLFTRTAAMETNYR